MTIANGPGVGGCGLGTSTDVSVTRITSGAGASMYGQNAKAETALTAALSQASSPRRRASILTDLAVLGTRQRDTAQLLHYATAAVDLAEQAGSPGYVGRKLHGLQAQLTPLLADSGSPS